MSETLELAKKIRDLYNAHPRFPTVEEVEKVLAEDQLMKKWSATFENAALSEKDMLLKKVYEVVMTFGIINVLDVLARLTEKDIKLMDVNVQRHIKDIADYLVTKAGSMGFAINTRYFP
jgi:hypothetical protein